MITTFVVTLSLGFFAFTAPSSASTGETFEVNISIEDIVNLWGLDLTLYYNTQSLDLIEAKPQPPWDLVTIVKNQIDDSKGTYRLAMAAFAPEPPFSGSTVLAKLTFVRTGDGESSLQLADTTLADRNGNPIRHTVEGCVIRGIQVHDVAITEITGYPRGAYQGDPIYLDVVAENHGDFVETFTVTVYADIDANVIADEVTVGTQQVLDLPAHTSKLLYFVWDTTDAPYGKYWISAQATEVLNEFDLENNFLKAGEFIGGVYPPPYVRSRADLLTQMISALAVATLAVGMTIRVKSYWCL